MSARIPACVASLPVAPGLISMQSPSHARRSSTLDFTSLLRSGDDRAASSSWGLRHPDDARIQPRVRRIAVLRSLGIHLNVQLPRPSVVGRTQGVLAQAIRAYLASAYGGNRGLVLCCAGSTRRVSTATDGRLFTDKRRDGADLDSAELSAPFD